MRDGDLALRALTIFDSPFLKAMFRNEEALNLCGTGRHPPGSCFSIWWSLRRIFPLAYCIECDRKRVGLIGLYDLKFRESAGMSLVIYDGDFRRKGYGNRAFNLLAHNLTRHRFVQKVFVEVATANYVSLSFWQKLGFAEEQRLHRKITLTLSLSKML